MGYTIMRADRDGQPHWTACYRDLKGRVRSAGTFRTEREAIREWHRKEAEVMQGRMGDPTRGRMKFHRYVEDTWLPNHVMEVTTRQSYTYAIYKHIMPEFGTMRMIDIQPDHVCVPFRIVTYRTHAGRGLQDSNADSNSLSHCDAPAPPAHL